MIEEPGSFSGSPVLRIRRGGRMTSGECR
jgi:hypothetical protein